MGLRRRFMTQEEKDTFNAWEVKKFFYIPKVIEAVEHFNRITFRGVEYYVRSCLMDPKRGIFQFVSMVPNTEALRKEVEALIQGIDGAYISKVKDLDRDALNPKITGRGVYVGVKL